MACQDLIIAGWYSSITNQKYKPNDCFPERNVWVVKSIATQISTHVYFDIVKVGRNVPQMSDRIVLNF